MKTTFILLIFILSLSCFAQVQSRSFRATDGKTYYLHADGKYYGTPGAARSSQAYSHQQSFRATDGKTYYLHSDGKYYGSPEAARSQRNSFNQQYQFQQPQTQQVRRTAVAGVIDKTYVNQNGERRAFISTTLIDENGNASGVIDKYRDESGQIRSIGNTITRGNGRIYYRHRDGNFYAYPERTQNRYYGEQQQVASRPHYQQSCHRPQQFRSLNNLRQFSHYQQQVGQPQQYRQRNFGSGQQKMLAKQKADYLAAQSAVQFVRKEDGSMGIIGLNHPNFRKDLAGARHEGVGFSTAGPQEAIDKCCYSGHCTSAKGPGFQRLATAVSRGRNGWYACILTNDTPI